MLVTSDCTGVNTMNDGQDSDFDGTSNDPNELDEFNGCSGPNGGDGGVWVTNNVNANPIVWTELLGTVTPTNPADPNGYAVQASVAGGVPTFYVAVSGGNTETEGNNQVWR